jgi:cytochrome c-type biogenesis protein CcmH/NrfG
MALMAPTLSYTAALSRVQQCRILLANGKTVEAIASVSDVLKENPDVFEAHILLGELSLAAPAGGSGAEKMFRNALVLRPNNQLALRLLAEALIAQGKLKAGADLLLTVLSKHPSDTKSLLVLAKVASKVGNSAAAESALRQIVRYEPHNSIVLASLAELLRGNGNLEAASELLDKIQTTEGLDVNTIVHLARLREHQERLDVAEHVLREGLRDNPKSRETAAALGDMLKRKGQLTEALIMHRHAAGVPIENLPVVDLKRKRALFVVQTGSSWQSLASVFKLFSADPNWQVTVVAVPFCHCHFTTSAERDAIFPFLEKEGIPYTRWDNYQLSMGCADIAFFYIPYEETLPNGWRLDDFLRAVPRIVYVPYALVIVGGPENTQAQFNLPLQQRAWLVIAHSERNRSIFARHCLTGSAHVQVTGHPKIDALRHLADIADTEMARFVSGRKMVCWNPHFDYRANDTKFGSGLSTFLRWKEFMMAEFSRRPELVFVIRPHPLFFSSLSTRGIWREDEAKEFEARIARIGNVIIDRRPSYLPVFAASTAMVSDASSLLLEYAATGKPLLYLRNPHGPELDDHADFVRDHLYTATEEADIQGFLDLITHGEDPRATNRRAAISNFIFQPDDGAASAVKDAIEARLEQDSVT